MEIVSSAPTIKQRRKFERIETSNMNNQDTSSINHVSDVDTIGKLSKCVHGEVQMLADCCNESIKKFFLQEENEYRRKRSDPINDSSIRKNHRKMKNTLLCVIAACPFVISIIAFSITYAMCILAGHAEPGILYISEVAMNYPESNFFALSLNMVSITVVITLVMRHLLLHQYLRDYGQERIKESWVNIQFWDGVIISFSIELIGNFPTIDITNGTLHFIGVIVFFVCTIAWSLIQTMITYYTINVLCDQRVYYLRFIITMLLLTSAFASFVPGVISWYQFHGENYRNWRPSDGGWIYHVISVIAEWLFVFCANFYVMTLTYEFSSTIFYMPVVKIGYLARKEKVES